MNLEMIVNAAGPLMRTIIRAAGPTALLMATIVSSETIVQHLHHSSPHGRLAQAGGSNLIEVSVPTTPLARAGTPVLRLGGKAAHAAS